MVESGVSLQPDINQFSSQLLPSLLDYLAHVTSGDAIRAQGEANVSLTRTFYALEKFCESLGEEFWVKHLYIHTHTRTDRHSTHTHTQNNIHLLCTESDVLPYLPTIMEKFFITYTSCHSSVSNVCIHHLTYCYVVVTGYTR